MNGTKMNHIWDYILYIVKNNIDTQHCEFKFNFIFSIKIEF